MGLSVGEGVLQVGVELVDDADDRAVRMAAWDVPRSQVVASCREAAAAARFSSEAA